MSGLKPVLESLAERLKMLQDLRLLVVFGSVVEGVARKDSDVDVVIDASEKVIGLVYDELKREFKGREIHMVRACWLKPEALLNIAKKGIILVDRDVLSRVALRISTEYFEFKEVERGVVNSWLRKNPLDLHLIMTIVGQVDEDVDVLKKLANRLSEVFANPVLRRAFERALHTSIEGMLDILRHIVSRITPGSFETYKELVSSAENLGIVSSVTAGMLRDLVDARHILIHRYRGIAESFLEESLNKVVNAWQKMKEEVEKYLEEKSKANS